MYPYFALRVKAIKKHVLLFTILTILLFGFVLLSLSTGPVPFSTIVQAILYPDWESNLQIYTIIWQIRVPRTILGILIGAALAAAGTGYQGLFRNPLADPFVIGASSGAALGASVAIIFQSSLWLPAMGTVSFFSLAGALGAVAIVYAIASAGKGAPVVTLLLAGTAMSSFAGAMVSLLMYLNVRQLPILFGWLMGSLTRGGWETIAVIAPMIAIGIAGLWLLARPLDSLTFGEEAAASLGLNLTRFRSTLIIAATVATAAAVAGGGIIGFVGLIAPHTARLIFGARHAIVIPASCLIGAMLLLIADTIARSVIADLELPVGIVTALLGSPFFLYLLMTKQPQLRSGL